MNEIWILGATGRTGRAVAAKLAALQTPAVLVGRDAARLGELAQSIGGARILVAASVEAIVAEIGSQAPSVVFNTHRPVRSKRRGPSRGACLPTTHYVDVSNELSATAAILDLNDEAVAGGPDVGKRRRFWRAGDRERGFETLRGSARAEKGARGCDGLARHRSGHHRRGAGLNHRRSHHVWRGARCGTGVWCARARRPMPPD